MLSFCLENSIPTPEEYVADLPDPYETEMDIYNNLARFSIKEPPHDTFGDKVVSFFSGKPTPYASYAWGRAAHEKWLNPNSSAPTER